MISFKEILIGCLLFFLTGKIYGQGIISGNILNEKKNSIEGATVKLLSLQDSIKRHTTVTEPDGSFTFSNIPFGYYSLQLSYASLQSLIIDSIHFRTERFDFKISDIILKPKNTAARLSRDRNVASSS